MIKFVKNKLVWINKQYSWKWNKKFVKINKEFGGMNKK